MFSPFLSFCFLVPFLTLFFMLDGPELKTSVFALMPVRSVETMLHLVVQIDNSLGNYIRGIILQSLGMGAAAALGYRLIGLHYSLQVGLWVAVTSVVPLVGPAASNAA